jgi:nicotinate-nucleotide adenylyltransferase
MIQHARLGILGGTLDPIHLGHLDAALAARAALALDHVVILPSRMPPHRPNQPHASGYHRFAMAALAAAEHAGLLVSDVELCSPGPSYTADTLARLHASGLEPSQIFFITGADAFAEIETWSRYPEVLSLAHFVVVSRPGTPAETMRSRLPGLASRMLPADAATAGSNEASIFLLDARTRDISSTEVRRRLTNGEAAAELLPRSVEAHIRRHGLYSRQPVIPTADHLHGQDLT